MSIHDRYIIQLVANMILGGNKRSASPKTMGVNEAEEVLEEHCDVLNYESKVSVIPFIIVQEMIPGYNDPYAYMGANHSCLTSSKVYGIMNNF